MAKQTWWVGLAWYASFTVQPGCSKDHDTNQIARDNRQRKEVAKTNAINRLRSLPSSAPAEQIIAVCDAVYDAVLAVQEIPQDLRDRCDQARLDSGAAAVAHGQVVITPDRAYELRVRAVSHAGRLSELAAFEAAIQAATENDPSAIASLRAVEDAEAALSGAKEFGASRSLVRSMRKRLEPIARRVRRAARPHSQAQAGEQDLQALRGDAGPDLSMNLSDDFQKVRDAVRRVAHDPSSVDLYVENCGSPVLTKERCWVFACRFRAKNAFGATVLNTAQFSKTARGISLLSVE